MPTWSHLQDESYVTGSVEQQAAECVEDRKSLRKCVHAAQQTTGSDGRVKEEQVAQLSQRDRAAGWVSYGQKWKTVNGRQHFTDIIGLSSTTMT